MLGQPFSPVDIIPSVRLRRGLTRFPRAEVEEIGDHLGILQCGARADRLVRGTWFRGGLQSEAGVDQRFSHWLGSCGMGRLEHRQPPFRFGRCGREEPLGDLAIRVEEVVADLDRIGLAARVPQVPAVRRVETRVADRELEEPARLQDANRLPRGLGPSPGTSMKLMNRSRSRKQPRSNGRSIALATR